MSGATGGFVDADHCWFHGFEPIPPGGAFLICLECGHSYDTQADLEQLALEELGFVGDIHELYMCPLCSHDF